MFEFSLAVVEVSFVLVASCDLGFVLSNPAVQTEADPLARALADNLHAVVFDLLRSLDISPYAPETNYRSCWRRFRAHQHRSILGHLAALAPGFLESCAGDGGVAKLRSHVRDSPRRLGL